MPTRGNVISGDDAKRFLERINRSPTAKQRERATALCKRGRDLLERDGHICSSCGTLKIR